MFQSMWIKPIVIGGVDKIKRLWFQLPFEFDVFTSKNLFRMSCFICILLTAELIFFLFGVITGRWWLRLFFDSFSETLFWLWAHLQKEADFIYYSLPFKDPLIAVRPHESWNDWLCVSNHHALYQLPLYQLPFNYNYSSCPHVWLCKWTDGPRKPPLALPADLIKIRHCSISAHYTKVNLSISCPWRPTQLLASHYLMFAVPTCWIQYFFLVKM